MTISEDPEGKRLANYMRQVSEVNAYQHKVYLAQFRVEKANARLTDALNAQDAAAFEQARVQLVEDSKTATTELAAITPFRGKDAQYRDHAPRNLSTLRKLALTLIQRCPLKMSFKRKPPATMLFSTSSWSSCPWRKMPRRANYTFGAMALLR